MSLSEGNYAELEQQILSGTNAAVSMGTAVHDALEGMYQVPAPPEESNPVSRRIRQALRQVVEGEGGQRTQVLNSLYEQGRVSRGTLLLHLGLSENSTQEELNEALGRLSPDQLPPGADRIRGRQQFGTLLDDAAYFPATPGTYAPQIIGDTHLEGLEGMSSRSQAVVEAFQAVYGGDPYHRHSPQSAGVEPSFQTKVPRVRVPKTPEDRTAIPTRYCRKPVI